MDDLMKIESFFGYEFFIFILGCYLLLVYIRMAWLGPCIFAYSIIRKVLFTLFFACLYILIHVCYYKLG